MATATDEPKKVSGQLMPAQKQGPQAFRQLATKMATELLTDWVGAERCGEAVGRIGAALASAAASAKKPEDFYSCTPGSIANCVALAALTGIMPSTGATALAYLVPRSPRKGEQKQLQYQFSHRGLNALAQRSGQTMIGVPISYDDKISVTESGEVSVSERDFDNPPTTFDDLRGVALIVKNINTGAVITSQWVAKTIIERRREDSDSYNYALKNDWAKDTDPWHQWPVEMAVKAAMHYAVGRGWCVIDDTSSVRALAAEVASDSLGHHKTAGHLPPARASSLDGLQDAIEHRDLGDVAAEEIRSVMGENSNPLTGFIEQVEAYTDRSKLAALRDDVEVSPDYEGRRADCLAVISAHDDKLRADQGRPPKKQGTLGQ